MREKESKKDIPLLNTTISEMPVNDLPIDALTKGTRAHLSSHSQTRSGRKSK
ncbi:MAG: hypothetical protein P4N41_17170 [Negativicutes bacterium]|nr:hypothetical protein [Negativicutes bacterium]